MCATTAGIPLDICPKFDPPLKTYCQLELRFFVLEELDRMT